MWPSRRRGLGRRGAVHRRCRRTAWRAWCKFFDPQFNFIAKFDPHGTIKAQMEKSLATRDTNYQLEQSQIAVGAGGPLGVGLMNGRQKLMYLPEAHTDFIYAVVGEELGLFGTVGLLAGFRGDLLARPARHPADAPTISDATWRWA